jgi:hypothetical protein
MPLITCPDCGKEHSDQALSCPQCGRPNKATDQPKNETQIKKKGGCATGCLGVLVVLFVLGAIVSGVNQSEQQARVKNCNEGKSEECEALLNDPSFKDYTEITNKEYFRKFTEKSEKAAKASRDATLLYACEKALKESLKDPDSLRVLNKDRENLLIEYTATNGFGGRVRNVVDCKTGRNQ